MHQLPAFANMTMSVRRELCSVMVFEVVEQAGTVILHDKQEVRTEFEPSKPKWRLVAVTWTMMSSACFHSALKLDLWYVILNGAVEIGRPEGRAEMLCMGNSFGISASLEKQYMNGEVRTKGDDCQVRVNVIFFPPQAIHLYK